MASGLRFEWGRLSGLSSVCRRFKSPAATRCRVTSHLGFRRASDYGAPNRNPRPVTPAVRVHLVLNFTALTSARGAKVRHAQLGSENLNCVCESLHAYCAKQGGDRELTEGVQMATGQGSHSSSVPVATDCRVKPTLSASHLHYAILSKIPTALFTAEKRHRRVSTGLQF